MEQAAGLAFRQAYGAAPTGVWAAPGRINLIGEHTDYNDGYVLPFALPLRTQVAAAPVDESRWTVWSSPFGAPVSFTEDDLVPGTVTGWAAYPAGVVWALRKAGHPVPGARLAVTSDLPPGAGLSSSAALSCAVLTALLELAGLTLPRSSQVALAHRAEYGYVGVPCGIMDQSTVLLSRTGHALFLDCRSGAARHVPFDPGAAGLALLVIDTNAPHQLVGGEYAARRASCEHAAGALGVSALRELSVDGLTATLAKLPGELTRRRVRHVVTENQRVRDTVSLLQAGRMSDIGPLLTASHASLRDDYEVTVPELDTAVEAAMSAGALGARMTGGGFGGCVIALAPVDATEHVAGAIAETFATVGFSAPRWFSAAAGPGATRVA